VLAALACGVEEVPPAASGSIPVPTDTEEASSDEGDESVLPKLDIFASTSVDWFLHLPPNEGTDKLWQIWHIDVDTGAYNFVCFVIGSKGEPWPTSSTFTRDDRLMVSNGYDLWEVALPSCEGSKVTTYPPEHSIINGIAPDSAFGLLGISATSNQLIQIDPDTGAIDPVGDFGFELSGAHGATWVEEEGSFYLVEGSTDALFRVDQTTGLASFVTDIAYDFEWVGFEHHPHTGEMYGCSSEQEVFLITEDGSIEELMDVFEPCNNLAAPWEQPELPPIG
jgi:hypothetical protein